MIDGSGTINPAALNTPGITIPLYTFIHGSCLDYEACYIGGASAKPFYLIPVVRDSHVITRRISKGVTDAGASPV